jgi:hypothetical protein
MSSSPANCPSTLAVTSVSDYDGQPGTLSTPANETDLDDTFTDFSNWGNNGTANRTIAGPGETCCCCCCCCTNKCCLLCYSCYAVAVLGCYCMQAPPCAGSVSCLSHSMLR